MTSAESGVSEPGLKLASRVRLWTLRLLVTALSLTAAEVLLVRLALPAAFSDALGGALLATELVALYFWIAAPVACVGFLFSRLAKRLHAPRAALTYSVGSAVIVGAITQNAIDGIFARAAQEFPERVSLVELAARAAVLLAVVFGGYLFIYPATIWLLERAPRFASPRLALGSAFGGAALALVFTVAFGLYPLGLDEFCLPVGFLALVLILGASALAIADCAKWIARAALGAVVLFTLLTPVSWLNPHARFIAYGHCPFAGPALGFFRDLVDFDRDGSSAVWFGGTDCAENDGRRGPLQREVPGDGIDQDCRGGDASPYAPVPPPHEAAPGCAPREGRPNVLLITIDALRHDALSEKITPQLLQLARSSRVFSRAYSPGTLTRTSFASIMGGRPLSDLGSGNLYVDANLSFGPSLATRFRDAGYATFAFHYFPWPEGAFAGFEGVNPAPVRDPSFAGAKAELSSARMTNGILETLEKRGGRRFFIWAHFPDLHAPYLKPGDPQARRAEANPYLRTLGYVDHHIGRLLVELERRDLVDSTIVVVSADHGEALGQRGVEGHGSTLFEEIIRVPLLVLVPGCGPEVVDAPVSVSELGATLGMLLELPIPGRSLFSPREGQDADAPPVVVEAALTRTSVVKRAIVTSRHKLIHDVRNGGYLLFDLESDPDESRSIYIADSGARADLQARYQRWLDRPGAR